MSLREQIQQLIDQKGISVAKASRLADMHQDTLYNFLDGRAEMTAANLDKLFDVLKSYIPDTDKSSSERNNTTNPDNQSQEKTEKV